MGCCLTCFKIQDEVNERTPLTDMPSSSPSSSRDPSAWNGSRQNIEIDGINQMKKKNGRSDHYYQKIIDEAHGRFLSSSTRTRTRTSSNAQQEANSIRNRFMNLISGKEIPIASSPPSRTYMDRSSHPDLTMNTQTSAYFGSSASSIMSATTSPSVPPSPSASNSSALSATVVSILSEPGALSIDMELVADEIGELVSRHVYKIPIDEDGGSAATLVQFRPVTTK